MRLIVEAAVTFIVTNMDELFILMTLYLSVGAQLKKREIILGQFFGLSTLILLSLFGSMGTNILPTQYLSLFGLIPIYLGMKGLMAYFNQRKKQRKAQPTSPITETKETSKQGVLKITTIFIASGADNIGLYLPLFTKQTKEEIFWTILAFFALLPVWNLFAQSLANLPLLKKTIHQYKNILVPFIFILLGLYILLN